MATNYNMPFVLGSLAAGNQPLSDFDTDFDAVARMGTYMCSAAGTNTITLTALTGYPVLNAYGNIQKIGFIPVNSTTSATTIAVSPLAFANAYLNDGVTQVGASGNNNLTAGRYCEFAYNSTLNSSAGGWQLVNSQSNANSGSNVAASSPGGYINKFRNGTMDIWQRGTAVTTISTSGAYYPDGWIITPTGASCTAIQTTTNTRSGALTTHSLMVTGATSVTGITVKQRIESVISQQLEGQTCTVQAQVYNNTGTTITPALTVKHAGTTDNWGAPVTDINAVAMQACASGGWTQICYTFNASTSSGTGLEVTFDFGNNFSTTGKDIQITELDLRATPGASTGVNSSPPPIETLPYPAQLSFCQRYLAVFNGTNGVLVAPAYAATSVLANAQYVHKVYPRTVFTGVTTTAANAFSFSAAAGNATCTSITLNVSGYEFTSLNCGASVTAGQGGLLFSASNSQIVFTGAEL